MRKRKQTKKKKIRSNPKLRIFIIPGIVLFCAGALFFLLPKIHELIVRGTAQCGLIVEDIQVKGQNRASRSEIDAILQPYQNKPILLIDLQNIHEKITKVKWVKQAIIKRLWPVSLHADITEYEPLATWHHQGKVLWIDRTGQVIGSADNSIPNLPVISGENAPQHIAELLNQIQSYPTLWSQVSAFSHIRKRRWNIILNNNTLVRLPQLNFEKKLGQIDQWLEGERIPMRGIKVIDCRMDEKYVLDFYPGFSAQINE